MPPKAKKPCASPRCPELTIAKYCEKHQRKAEQERSSRHRYYDDHVRDKKASDFYHSVEWQRVRQQALMRDRYLCQHCFVEKKITLADMVHHKVPLRDDWNLRLVLINLISLCNACHNKVHGGK